MPDTRASSEPEAVDDGSAASRPRDPHQAELVVVSNRLPVGRPTGVGGELEIPSGGLVSALLGALADLPHSEWVGWERAAASGITQRRAQGVDLVGVPLTAELVARYYDGFCNQALWPLLHCFQGRVRCDPLDLDAYRVVQERFADAIAVRLGTGARVWVHDYHLLLLGEALRKRGVGGRIGFFLHTPFPPDDIWTILPDADDFLRALGAYDVIGFHTPRYVENYVLACRRELDAQWDGEWLTARHRDRQVRQRVVALPVGIETRLWEPDEAALKRQPASMRLARMARGRRVVIGVDRLDYTKGLVERCRAFEMFLRRHPEWSDRVVYLQIASPSRGDVLDYKRERADLENVVSRVNGELGGVDWTPIRYIHRSYPREELARFYRQADVALVTPLRDGMNLVAKEYVAAQRPDDPGVLVLSRFAGAADAMPEALRVNPYVPAQTGDAIAQALAMDVEERRQRHAALLKRVRAEDARAWADRFLALL
jgi:trehalose 6-phosphate synthase